MIRMLSQSVQRSSSMEEYQKYIESKTLKTTGRVELLNTLNMIDNDKDFYGYYKEDTLVLTRIRRLSFLRILPKLIVTFKNTNTFQNYELRLGILTFLFVALLVILLVINTYKLISTGRFTNGFEVVLILLGITMLLIWVEIIIYKAKLKR